MKNSIKLIMLVISALLFIGCTIQDPDYDFKLVGWSDEEKTIISDAIDDWGSTITINNSSENIIIKKDQLEPNQIGYVYFSNDYNSKWATINVLKDLDDKKMRMTIHHEIGHFLAEMNGKNNWRSHIGPGNVMSAYAEEASEYITDADMKYAFGD